MNTKTNLFLVASQNILRAKIQAARRPPSMAHALEVTPIGFYAHQQKPRRPRRQRDQALLQKIKPIFKESKRTYGSPRLCASLRQAGERCGKNRIARIMRENKMKARQKRRFVPRTTPSDHDYPIAPNWLAKVPRPDQPDQIWVVDITYIETAEGWIYLAVILDVCSRKVVGWAISISLETTLVTAALKRAQKERRPAPGLLQRRVSGVTGRV